jgi:GNAT superfamily N-acetyltransferase
VTITVRPASSHDAASLAPLLAALGYPTDIGVIADRLRALQGSGAEAVLVAERDGRLLGFATLHRTLVLHRPSAVARITGLAVSEEARGLGAGRLLVEAAERLFASEGLTRIEVTSGPLHEPAHAFYRHLGYEDQGVRFAKALK